MYVLYIHVSYSPVYSIFFLTGRTEMVKSSEGKRPSAKLEDVIENIGMGPAQIAWCLLGGGIWLADGAELLLVSAVTRRAS